MPNRKINPKTHRLGDFHQFPYQGQRFAKSFFPYITKKYNFLNFDTRKLLTEEFKLKLSSDMKPIKQKHFSAI